MENYFPFIKHMVLITEADACCIRMVAILLPRVHKQEIMLTIGRLHRENWNLAQSSLWSCKNYTFCMQMFRHVSGLTYTYHYFVKNTSSHLFSPLDMLKLSLFHHEDQGFEVYLPIYYYTITISQYAAIHTFHSHISLPL